MNGTEYAQKHGVRFDWTSHGCQRDDSGWEHQAFKVMLTAGGDVTETFDWRQGLGIDSDPDVGRVLESLALDAHAGESTFREFCDDLGYSGAHPADAHETWEACKRIREQLIRLFGEVPDISEEW